MLNRAELFQAIGVQCSDAQRRFAVASVHVHGLREFNLRHGYEHGEQVEALVGDLIRRALRPDDQVFRAAGDRFFVILPQMHNGNHALLGAARLASAFESPLTGTTVPWRGRVTIGMALYPDHGANADLLCRRAELANDEAQRRGEHHAMYASQGTRIEIFYEELREAIEANRLQTFFQPICDLRTGAIAGAESLARWHSAHNGEVPPADFVPFAEHSDLISSLTRWSVNATLRHIAAMAHATDLFFAINFSPRVFTEPGLVEQLFGALNIWGVEPSCVIAEITETALVHDVDSSVEVMRRLRDRGVRISIDDFGTGYASFSYLRRFPATELKIDMSLVADMRDDVRSCKLVRAMIDMAHHLDMTAVAEGIEDQATRDLLADIGCDFGQGYHLGRPQPASEFADRVARQKSGIHH